MYVDILLGQGDQIRRIFAWWAIFFTLGSVLKRREVEQFF
jgi:hypothetical protein